ncbi:hypothetical protein H4696_003822 [Amycolatopsis lexingtonensis]|uniref:SAF domain-containing protein n=1 Tax=Amycolatopsis lexingtonensis TaxID=218822 RepID=A0ABR9I0J5_9PSEU|nr:hypothetical protein [Amycolatopsis lexingtonensis]MBE1496722.1 hypothetical protein [Amycolatopsis lexingtonensis]
MSTALLKKIGVGVVAVAVFGLLALLGRGRVSLDQNQLLGTGCAIPAKITAVPGPAPDGGAVRVAEQGPGAAVLENTSTLAAYRIVVTSGGRTAEVPVLTPGQRIGVVLDRPAVGPVTWLAPEALGGFTPVTASVVPGGIRYHSANCRALTSRGAAVLHRDPAGHLTGGDRLPSASVSCAPGDHVLPGAGAEVYPYCALGSE